MAFTRLTSELNTIEQLADRPNKTSGITATQLKQFFDDNAQTIKTYLNDTLLEQLEGGDGATNIGIFPSAHFPDVTTLQEAIEYLYNQITGVTLSVLVDGSVTTAKLYQGAGSEAVTTATIRAKNVTTAKIDDSAITTEKINDSAVTTAKINTSAVTTEKISSKAVTGAKIADGTITSTQLGNASVTNAKIDDSAVETSNIKDANVTTAKLASGAVTTAKLGDGAVTVAKTTGIQAQHKTVGITIPSGSTTQTVTVAGVTSTNTVIVTPASASFSDWRNYGVRCTAQATNSLTFTSDVSLTNALSANVLILD